jgi:TRAP-type C4-dicarboxylate transport system substrate-binding protein
MLSRRKFIQYSTGLTGLAILPQTILCDEINKQKLAKYTFKFSSPYKTNDSHATPHAHLAIKQLIEKYSNNNIFVEIRDNGMDGIGSALASSVRHGVTNGALISMSNLSPRIPELDILNIPFWSASPKEYSALCNSDVWHKNVLAKFEKHQYYPLLNYVVGARTATSTKKYGKRIVAPEDFIGLKIRIARSKSLSFFYQLMKARTQNIDWALTARTARANRFQALDPSITGLYAGPGGLRNELGIISEIESVHDGWIAITDLAFINALDPKIKKQFLLAWEEIREVQLLQHENTTKFCSSELEKLGTKIYKPTKHEKNALENAFGHERAEWIPVKKRLLGTDGMLLFDQMYKAAKG